MILFRELLFTPSGFLSLAGIIFMIGMVVFFLRYFIRHMKQEERAAAEHAGTERATAEPAKIEQS